MEAHRRDDGRVALILSGDELLTLRHYAIEILEVLDDQDFMARTGAPKATAREMLDALVEASRLFGERPSG